MEIVIPSGGIRIVSYSEFVQPWPLITGDISSFIRGITWNGEEGLFCVVEETDDGPVAITSVPFPFMEHSRGRKYGRINTFLERSRELLIRKAISHVIAQPRPAVMLSFVTFFANRRIIFAFVKKRSDGVYDITKVSFMPDKKMSGF